MPISHPDLEEREPRGTAVTPVQEVHVLDGFARGELHRQPWVCCTLGGVAKVGELTVDAVGGAVGATRVCRAEGGANGHEGLERVDQWRRRRRRQG